MSDTPTAALQPPGGHGPGKDGHLPAREPDREASRELGALLTLRFTPGLGPRRVGALLTHFGSAAAALAAPRDELRAVPGLDARSAAVIGSDASAERAAQELQAARREGVTLLGRGQPGYPAALAALPDPPVVLWVRGDLPALDVVPRAVAVVGTRAASPGALAFTRRLARDLATAGVLVTSGLARGVDTAAHTGCLEVGAPTLAVLGCGVNVVYPPENGALAARAVLLSEHPLGTGPAAHHFPGRNRLIAALSAATVVVEGSFRSGALHTAASAAECGRAVFAVPGTPGDARTQGPHRLLREGAALCEGADDVLQELGWGKVPTVPAPDLPADLARALAAVTGAVTLDEVAARLNVPSAQAQVSLMRLTLQGLVSEAPGGRYTRV